jgi:hypothetical protein
MLLVSCSSLTNVLTEKIPHYTDDSREVAETMLVQVIESIKTKDKEGIKSLFSEEALEGAVDLDGGIEYVLDFVKGDILSWRFEAGGSVEDSGHGRITRRGFGYRYYVDTDAERYFFYLLGFTIYDENPEKIGLEMLQVIKAEDKDTQFDGGGTVYCLGVYRPELMTEQLNILRANNRLYDIEEALGWGDKAAVKAMFSEQAAAEAADMDGDIDYLFEFVKGSTKLFGAPAGGVETYGDLGREVTMSRYLYKVPTDEDEEYLFFMVECLNDEARPENVGLYMLQVIKAEDAATQFDEGREILCPGIYRPEKFADVIREREAASAGGAGAETGGGRR